MQLRIPVIRPIAPICHIGDYCALASSPATRVIEIRDREQVDFQGTYEEYLLEMVDDAVPGRSFASAGA